LWFQVFTDDHLVAGFFGIAMRDDDKFNTARRMAVWMGL